MDTTTVANGMGITAEELEAIIERITQAWKNICVKIQEALEAIAEAFKDFFDVMELTKSDFHPEWRNRYHSLEPRFSRHPDAKLGKQYQFTHLAGRR